MPAQYPFIDVAVHDLIRPRLARGEALVLFAPGLERVLWCNGAGARFFGAGSIYDFLEEGPNRTDITFRQIETTVRQLSAPGDRRSLMLRIPSGFQKVPVTATAELVEIRKGEPVILLAVPALKRVEGHGRPLALELMSGFDDPDTHMAVLDGEGGLVAHSDGFAALSITPQTARMLINLVEADADRLVKRPIPTGRGYLPAAIGKIADAPGLYLLFTVETILGQMDPSDDFSRPEPESLPVALAEAIRADDTIEDAAEVDTGTSEQPEAETIELETIEDETVASERPDLGSPELASPAAPFESVIAAIGDIEEIESETDALDERDETIAGLDIEEPITETQAEVSDEPAPTVDLHEEPLPEEHATEDLAEVSVPDTAPVAASAPLAAPLSASMGQAVDGQSFVFRQDRRATRFVWKIDAEGRFTEVSSEFAQAVGPRAADIQGVAFSDLAALFNLDPEGKIVELLKKRDTWSGKTIYWPVEGTSLVVPVDLAALPTYTRNREFDGFRGFGIVRVADAQQDPDATGMTFVRPEPTAEIVPDSAIPVDPDRAEELDEFLTELSEGESHPPEDFIEDQIAEAGQDTLDALIDEHDEEDEEQTDITVDEPEASQNEPAARPVSYEPPVLRIMEPRKPSLPDKVVQLQDHRARQRDSLTPGEQAAFQEIARKLDPLGLRAKVEQSLATSEPPALRTEPATMAPKAPEPPAPATPTAVSEAATSLPQAEATLPDLHGERPLGKRERSLTAEIIDLMPVALLVHVGDRLIHANPEFFSLTGYKTLAELDEAGGLDTLIQRRDLEEPGDEAGQVLALCADDRLLPITARLQSVRFEDTSALMLALIAKPEAQARPETPAEPQAVAPVLVAPVAPPAQAGELVRLKVEVDELRSILETATDGVVILDSDGDIRSMNRAASALFNFDDMETRGKPFVMLFAHESQKSILDYLNGLSGHGVASVLNDGREVIGREASGGFLPLFMTIGRLNSSNGYCAVIRDITQWKRTEEELRNAKRAAETANAHKTDFLARVSHEIRTPLNAIIGFADMMANEHFGPVGHPRYGEYAHDIVRSGRHVLDIVNDLLDISKIEAGEMELDFSSVGLNEMVQAAVSIVQPQANSQRVIIRTALSQAVPNVVADGRSIKQIVLNILANAIRFTPSGGQIIVSTAYEANGSVVLRIRDTGIGMSRSELEQAMKPFRQVSTGTPRNRGDGTGLGLPLTKAMVDANRAQFAISSTPNEGTLVEVTFPSPRVLAD